MVRIIIAGSRTFADGRLMANTLVKYMRDKDLTKDQIEIVSGGAKGADKLAEELAKNNGLRFKQFPADWDQFGKYAGPERNRRMANYAAEETGVQLAFWDGSSRGTENMIDAAHKKGLDVRIIRF